MADIPAIELSVNSYNESDHALVFFNKTTGEVFQFSPSFSGGGGGGALTRGNYLDKLSKGYLGQRVYNFSQDTIGSVMNVDMNWVPSSDAVCHRLSLPYGIKVTTNGVEELFFGGDYGLTLKVPGSQTNGYMNIAANMVPVATTNAVTGANVLADLQMAMTFWVFDPFWGIAGNQGSISLEMTESTEFYFNLYYDPQESANWTMYWENSDGNSGVDNIDTGMAYLPGAFYTMTFSRHLESNGTYTITCVLTDGTTTTTVYSQTGNTNTSLSASVETTITFQKTAGTDYMECHVTNYDGFATLTTV